MRQFCRRSAVLVLVLASCLGMFSSPALAQLGRVTGTVKDEAGQPISGAVVTAENPGAVPNTVKATTDQRGRFSMIGLQKGGWAFTASAEGFQAAQGRADITTLRPNEPIEFRLRRGGAARAAAATSADTPKEAQPDLEAGRALMEASKFGEAVAAYRAALAKAPSSTPVKLQLGHALRLAKEYDKALEVYGDVLSADPSNARARVAVGMIRLEKGDLSGADVALTDAAGVPSAGREVFYSLGEVKFALGRPEEAAKWYQRAADTDPSWVKPVFKLGVIAVSANDKATAIRFFEKAVAIDPASPEAAQARAAIEQLRK